MHTLPYNYTTNLEDQSGINLLRHLDENYNFFLTKYNLILIPCL